MENQRPLIDLGAGSYAGPVAKAFELSRKPVAVIIGPTGGGKTQAAARRILRVALNQYPSPKDGVRKARIVVVCPTYRRLWDTVLPSYKKVWGSICPENMKGGQNDPVTHIMDFSMSINGVSTPLHIEVLFRAVQDASLEEFVRGFETTAWWFPEMDTMPAEDLVSLASNRVGRYPEPDDRPELAEDADEAYRGVWGDANAPVIDTWFHKRFYLGVNRQAGDAVFRQPAGILADGAANPLAENIQNLRKISRSYYADLAATMEDYDVGRLLKCKPGYSRLGKPVFEEFDDQTMVGAAAFDPALPLLIGADVGTSLRPGALFMQRAWNGEIRVLHEITALEAQMDLITLGQEILRVAETKFKGAQNVEIVADPSSAAKSSQNSRPFAMILQGEAGIAVRLAPTNDIKGRLTAVRQVMKRRAGATYRIAPSCTGLIAALSGGYCYQKVGNAYSPLPKKNEHADVADALQYGTLGLEGLGVAGGGFISPPAAGGQDERSIAAE